METSKNYRVLVEQVDRFSYEFNVRATSKAQAKRLVEKMIEEEPLDIMKNTYDSTEVTVEVVSDSLQVHTVESLFDIDKDISDEEVILLDDLTEKQKGLLGLVTPRATRGTTLYFCVGSSGGYLKVDAQYGRVIECTTIHNEDNELKQIVRFDIDEYKSHYKVIDLPEYLDILDLGYWNTDGSYEQPVEDWRKEMRRVE